MPFLIGKLIYQHSCDRFCIKMSKKFLELFFCVYAELLFGIADYFTCDADEVRIEKSLHFVPAHTVLGAAQQMLVFFT